MLAGKFPLPVRCEKLPVKRKGSRYVFFARTVESHNTPNETVEEFSSKHNAAKTTTRTEKANEGFVM